MTIVLKEEAPSLAKMGRAIPGQGYSLDMRLYDLNAYGNDHFVNIWIGTTIHALASCAVRSKDSKKMLEGTALIPWFAVEGIWTDIQSMGWNPRRTEFCAKCAISPITV